MIFKDALKGCHFACAESVEMISHPTILDSHTVFYSYREELSAKRGAVKWEQGDWEQTGTPSLPRSSSLPSPDVFPRPGLIMWIMLLLLRDLQFILQIHAQTSQAFLRPQLPAHPVCLAWL